MPISGASAKTSAGRMYKVLTKDRTARAGLLQE